MVRRSSGKWQLRYVAKKGVFMKKHIFFLTLFFAQLLLPKLISGQISFDVKTLMREKSDLRYIKLSVINNLENSNWASVTEVGKNIHYGYTIIRKFISRIQFAPLSI